ncbi:RidA family protein [Amycolatopsis minnesotensis]
MTSIERVTHDPDWYEPYRISLAIKANGLVFVSGQAGIDEQGRTVGGFEAQARQAFRNLRTVLGGSLDTVVKVTIMVTDMSHLDQIVRLREEYFTPPYPADTLVQVAGLAQSDWLIEIDAIAVDR